MTPKGIRVARKHLPWYLGLWLLAGISSPASAQGREQAQEPVPLLGQARTEIPYRDGMVILHYDFLESITKTRYRIKGHVVITFRDMRITCEEAEYDEATREGTTTGPTRFSQNQQWFTCSRSEFNLAKQTGKFYDATGYTDQQYLVQGKTVLKTGRDTYVVAQGSLTACLEKNPKWRIWRRRRHDPCRSDCTPPPCGIPAQGRAGALFPLPDRSHAEQAPQQRLSSDPLREFKQQGETVQSRVFSDAGAERGYDLSIGDYFSLRGLGIRRHIPRASQSSRPTSTSTPTA